MNYRGAQHQLFDRRSCQARSASAYARPSLSIEGRKPQPCTHPRGSMYLHGGRSGGARSRPPHGAHEDRQHRVPVDGMVASRVSQSVSPMRSIGRMDRDHHLTVMRAGGVSEPVRGLAGSRCQTDPARLDRERPPFFPIQAPRPSPGVCWSRSPSYRGVKRIYCALRASQAGQRRRPVVTMMMSSASKQPTRTTQPASRPWDCCVCPKKV